MDVGAAFINGWRDEALQIGQGMLPDEGLHRDISYPGVRPTTGNANVTAAYQ
jgi:hypothetical protein